MALNILIMSTMLMGGILMVALVAVALVSSIVARFVMMSLVAAGWTVAGFMVAGFVVLVGSSPVVSLVLSWLVFAAPLRALRALEALLRVFPFTGWAVVASSEFLALVTAGFALLAPFTGGAIWAGLAAASAAAFSSAAIIARVLRPEYVLAASEVEVDLVFLRPAETLAVLEAATGAGVVADLVVFLRPAGTLMSFEAATGAGVEADLVVFLRPVGALAMFEAATGAGVEADLVFLRGAMVSRVWR